MKICLIVDDYLPLSTKSAAKAMHCLAVEFIHQGHSVTVVTPNQGSKKQSSTFYLDSVRVCEFPSGRTKNGSKIVRLLNETLFPFRAWISFRWFFNSNPHDLIIYHSPSIFWGALVFQLKYVWNARSYLVLRDFFPQWVIDQNIISTVSPIAFYFRFFEKINYIAADIIGLQSPKNKDWFAATKLSSRSLEVLFNWAESESLVIASHRYRKSLGLQDKVVFFYGGNIGLAQDMVNIAILAKSMLQYSNAFFLLVGSGGEVDLLRSLIKRDEISNLLILPPVDQLEYRKMLAEFDVGLFSLHRNHTTHNFPGKLLEYMNQAKPILGCVNVGNDLKQIIDAASAGCISFSGESDVLFKNALKLLNDSGLRSQMGKNGKRLLTDVFSVKKAANQILRASGF